LARWRMLLGPIKGRMIWGWPLPLPLKLRPLLRLRLKLRVYLMHWGQPLRLLRRRMLLLTRQWLTPCLQAPTCPVCPRPRAIGAAAGAAKTPLAPAVRARPVRAQAVRAQAVAVRVAVRVGIQALVLAGIQAAVLAGIQAAVLAGIQAAVLAEIQAVVLAEIQAVVLAEIQAAVRAAVRVAVRAVAKKPVAGASLTAPCASPLIKRMAARLRDQKSRAAIRWMMCWRLSLRATGTLS